jgi:hypothetical protein
MAPLYRWTSPARARVRGVAVVIDKGHIENRLVVLARSRPPTHGAGVRGGVACLIILDRNSRTSYNRICSNDNEASSDRTRITAETFR